jgi:hypothetical protein
MDAEAGLGQLRGIGYLATKAVLDAQEVKTFVNETLFDLLMQTGRGHGTPPTDDGSLAAAAGGEYPKRP